MKLVKPPTLSFFAYKFPLSLYSLL